MAHFTYSLAELLLEAYPELSRADILVYLALRETGSWDKPARWCSLDTIAGKAGVNTSTVAKAYKRLVGTELLSRKAPNRRSSCYTLRLPTDERLRAFGAALARRGHRGEKLVENPVPKWKAVPVPGIPESFRQIMEREIRAHGAFEDAAPLWTELVTRWKPLEKGVTVLDDNGYPVKGENGKTTTDWAVVEVLEEEFGYAASQRAATDLLSAVESRKIATKIKDLPGYVREAFNRAFEALVKERLKGTEEEE